MLQDKQRLMLVFLFALANWDKTLSDGCLCFSFADNAATAKLLKRETRNFTSSVSDSHDRSITPYIGACVCVCSDVQAGVRLSRFMCRNAREHTFKALVPWH